jgi:hypothetical protein
MKLCKSCQKEIADIATKCPHCQAFQVWYKNPQWAASFFLIPFLILMLGFSFWSIARLKSEKYEQYKSDFKSEVVSQRTVSNGFGGLELTYSISNGTKYKWENIKWCMVGYDSAGKVVTSKTGCDYSWTVQPHDKALLTVTVDGSKDIKSWKLEITDLSTSRL